MKQFFRDMSSNSSNVSSNRIAFYIILTYIIGISTYYWNTLTPEQLHFLQKIFYTAAGLMGVKLVGEQFGGDNNEQDKNIPGE